MTKSLQRISAMASALVITFTTTMALAMPWDDFVARKKRAAMDKLEGVLEPFDFTLQVKRTITTSGAEDLLGRNFEQVVVIWVMFFALTMAFTKNWKLEEKSPYKHYFWCFVAYVLSVIHGRIYEGMRTFRHPDSLEYAGYMLMAVPIVLLLGLAVQHNWFRNLKTAFDTKGALREYLSPFKRLLPLHAIPGYEPATAGGPSVVPDSPPGDTPDTDPDTPTEPGQSGDTPDTPDSEPPPDSGRLRRPDPVKEMQCKGCGAGTPVGSDFCANCGNDPLKTKAEAPSAAENAGPTVVCSKGHTTPDDEFCGDCGERLKPAAAPTPVGLRLVNSKR